MPDFSLFGDEHVRQYEATAGKVGHDWNGTSCLILHTIGRKSGETRKFPQRHGKDPPSTPTDICRLCLAAIFSAEVRCTVEHGHRPPFGRLSKVSGADGILARHRGRKFSRRVPKPTMES
jgi:hypothetical protein